MNIQIKPELVVKLKHTLDLGRFKNIEELVEYLLENYIFYAEHDDDLIEVIDTCKFMNITHKDLSITEIYNDDYFENQTYDNGEDYE